MHHALRQRRRQLVLAELVLPERLRQRVNLQPHSHQRRVVDVEHVLSHVRRRHPDAPVQQPHINRRSAQVRRRHLAELQHAELQHHTAVARAANRYVVQLLLLPGQLLRLHAGGLRSGQLLQRHRLLCTVPRHFRHLPRCVYKRIHAGFLQEQQQQ